MASTHKAKIPVGFVIASKYKVTGELGRGGMAAVYEAENVDIGKRVAIKVLAAELISSTTVVERFLREARAVAAIRSPHICDVYDSGRLDDGRPFLVLELLEGESLYERMVRLGQIDVETTVSVMAQACRGLNKAHAQGIVHRDLKPENIFVTKDEEGRLLAKILDFGLAKFYQPMDDGGEQARLTREGAVFGTPAYMSPEQVRGQGAVDARADLWALGCIAYECLTGRTVWATDQGVAMTFAQIAANQLPDPRAYRQDLPESFRVWFKKALHKDIAQRFQTPKEFAEELALAMNLAPVSVRGSEASSHDVMLLSPRPEEPSPREKPPTPAAGVPAEKPNDSGVRGSRAHFVPSGNDSKPKEEPKSAGRALLLVATVALLTGGGYFAWRTYGGGQNLGVNSAALDAGPAVSASASATPSASNSGALVQDGGLPFRPLISDAQVAIAKGDLDGARAKVKEAFEMGAHYVPQTFMQHLDALKTNKAEPACKLTGLARPRSYDLMEEKVKVFAAGRPSIAFGPQGPVIAWTELQDGTEHAFALALDESMRARTTPFPVTPEGQSIQRPELLPVGERFLLSYFDTRGPDAGVYARFIDADGRIASPATVIAQALGIATSPAVVALPDDGNVKGGFIFTWVAPTEKNTEDLWARRFDADLKPVGEPIRLTAVHPSPVGRVRVRFPTAAFDGEGLRVTYRLDRDPERQVRHLRIPLADLAAPGVNSEGMTASTKDRNVGEVEILTLGRSRADWPAMACSGKACWVAWNDEGADGVNGAYFDGPSAKPLYKGEIVKRAGRHPGLGASKSGEIQLVWFERLRVMAGKVDRDGVHDPAAVARVAGNDQPPASVAPGSKAGEWLIAWQDYEGGHQEVYGARVECK